MPASWTVGVVAGELLQRALDAVGVPAVYGEPLVGLRVTAVASARVAGMMAESDTRLHGMGAAVHDGGGRLRLGRLGTPPAVELVVSSVDDVLALPGEVRRAGGAALVRVALDPSAPAPDVAPGSAAVRRWDDPSDELVERVRAAASPLVLAGPGVVDDRAVGALHGLAAAADLGVANTWGAKGVLDWRSRHHLATVGLQSRDFQLCGLGAADLLLAVGVDPREAPTDRWQLAPSVVLPTAVLGPLAERWRRPAGEVAVPPLRSGLAAVTQSGWASTAVPMAPSRVTRHYADVVEAGGVVAADPGIAGYWVARTLATTRPASVHVPAATGVGGFAVAVAVVSRLRRPWRPALAVVDGPASDAVAEVVDAGRRLGVAVGVEAWDPEGPPLGPDDHLARLASLVTAPGPVAALATDPRPLLAMLDVAGPVVVWGGLPGA